MSRWQGDPDGYHGLVEIRGKADKPREGIPSVLDKPAGWHWDASLAGSDIGSATWRTGTLRNTNDLVGHPLEWSRCIIKDAHHDTHRSDTRDRTGQPLSWPPSC